MKKDFFTKSSYLIGRCLSFLFLILGIISLLYVWIEDSSNSVLIEDNLDYWAQLIGRILGSVFFLYILFGFFKTIYNLINIATEYENNKISKSAFTIKIIFSTLFTIALSFSLITIPLLIPQYVVIFRSIKLLNSRK